MSALLHLEDAFLVTLGYVHKLGKANLQNIPLT